MKTTLALLFMCSAASAQTVWSSTATTPLDITNCCADGGCWMERGGVCHSNPKERQQFVLLSNGMVQNLSTNITNSPIPKCPDGYSLVDAGRPMCAKEMIEPIR